jgi:exodeoxyribonuclease VII large subunit
VRHRLDREDAWLHGARSRPVLADPGAGLRAHRLAVDALCERARRCLRHRIDVATTELTHRQDQVRALSPAATLQRGYAVVTRADGSVLRDPASAGAAEVLTVRVAEGSLEVTPAPGRPAERAP